MADFETHDRDTVNKLRQRIKELEDGSCRFNCRTTKEAFIAGYLADTQHGELTVVAAEIAYKEWKGESNSP